MRQRPVQQRGVAATHPHRAPRTVVTSYRSMADAPLLNVVADQPGAIVISPRCRPRNHVPPRISIRTTTSSPDSMCFPTVVGNAVTGTDLCQRIVKAHPRGCPTSASAELGGTTDAAQRLHRGHNWEANGDAPLVHGREPATWARSGQHHHHTPSGFRWRARCDHACRAAQPPPRQRRHHHRGPLPPKGSVGGVRRGRPAGVDDSPGARQRLGGAFLCASVRAQSRRCRAGRVARYRCGAVDRR